MADAARATAQPRAARRAEARSIERAVVILDGELLPVARGRQHEKGGGKFRRLLYVHQRNLLGIKRPALRSGREKPRVQRVDEMPIRRLVIAAAPPSVPWESSSVCVPTYEAPGAASFAARDSANVKPLTLLRGRTVRPGRESVPREALRDLGRARPRRGRRSRRGRAGGGALPRARRDPRGRARGALVLRRARRGKRRRRGRRGLRRPHVALPRPARARRGGALATRSRTRRVPALGLSTLVGALVLLGLQLAVWSSLRLSRDRLVNVRHSTCARRVELSRWNASPGSSSGAAGS